MAIKLSYKPTKDEKLELLLGLISQINSKLELNSVLEKIIDAAKIITESEDCSVFLLDELSGELILGSPGSAVGDELTGRRIPLSEGIAGWVARNGVPQIVNNVQVDVRFRGDVNPDTFKTRNMLCIPLQDQTDKIIGVLQAKNKIDGNDYHYDEITLFQALSDQAAIAIINSRLNEERETLLDEIQHRVQNNMAVISGLMQIQAHLETEVTLRGKLLENVARISSMATIHEYFYSSKSFSKLNFTEAIEQVVTKTIQTLESKTDISTFFENDYVTLNINQSIPCSLLVSEVLLAIIKNSFHEQPVGEICFKLFENKQSGEITIVIEDNGVSLKNYYKRTSNKDNDLHFVEIFANQIEAKFKYESKADTNLFTVQFKVNEATGIGNHSF